MIIETAFFYLFIAALWWLYAFLYKNYMIDESRQLIFEIRDELFDKALEGEISFDDKAYGMTRDTLNGLIRFTHNVSLLRFLILNWVWKKFGSDYCEKFSRKLQGALDDLSPEQRKIYQMTLMRAHLVIVLHLVHTSLLLSIIFLPIRFILYVSRKIRHLKDQYNNNFASRDLFDSKKEIWKSIDARANFIAHSHF